MTSLLAHSEYLFFDNLLRLQPYFSCLNDAETKELESALDYFVSTDRERRGKKLNPEIIKHLDHKLLVEKGAADLGYAVSTQYRSKLIAKVKDCWTSHLRKIDLERENLLRLEGNTKNPELLFIADSNHLDLRVEVLIRSLIVKYATRKFNFLYLEGLYHDTGHNKKDFAASCFVNNNLTVKGWEKESDWKAQREHERRSTAYVAAADKRTENLIEIFNEYQSPQDDRRFIVRAGAGHIFRAENDPDGPYNILEHLKQSDFKPDQIGIITVIGRSSKTFTRAEYYKRKEIRDEAAKEAFLEDLKSKQLEKRFWKIVTLVAAIAALVLISLAIPMASSLLLALGFSSALSSLTSGLYSKKIKVWKKL